MLKKLPVSIFAWHRGLALLLYLIIVGGLIAYAASTMAKMSNGDEIRSLLLERFLSQGVAIFIIYFILLLAGMFYAMYISTFGVFPPKFTWVSVFFPDLLIDLVSGITIGIVSGSVVLGLVPILGHIVTGVSMISCQITKHYQQESSEGTLPLT